MFDDLVVAAFSLFEFVGYGIVALVMLAGLWFASSFILRAIGVDDTVTRD